ncbi:DegT/DnrJ/EryC1/StrS family aminotransferase [Candidatus Gottesmanbacteria bacterium]|nr:DegT/DnrJ/EryC1/StrS family aminotransferase [Candidatus Gottesmanbacteria bacterium]
MKSIPFWNPLPEYEEIGSEIHAAIALVLSSRTLILGPEVVKFEESFARFVGCRYGVGVGNGTDAINIGLRTLDIRKGDEVITAANTAIPTVAAIMAAGATPKLVDVLPDTLLMDPTKLQSRITKRTRCIIPVHLYGQSCDMDAIMKIARAKKLFVLEDCAQAAGATYKSRVKSQESRVGSIGDIAAFSFYPTKIIGAYGDAGMITTHNADLAKRARSLRMYGTKGSYIAKIEGGVNSRLDELHAAILSVKLRYIKKWIKERRRLAERYQREKIASGHVYHLYVVRHKKRDAIVKHLQKQGIHTAIHYPVPIHLMPAFRNLGYRKGDFPVTEEAARTILSLPLYPGLTDKEQDRVIKALSMAL